MNTVSLQLGDCRTVLKEIPYNSIDSIVTDPPYELGFMGKSWDRSGVAHSPEVWKECLRVLKPGGHLLAFGGARTYHRLASAIEDSGFEIRDQIMWLYGSGFPKSLNLEKSIDKALGSAPEVVGYDEDYARRNPNGKWGLSVSGNDNTQVRSGIKPITQPSPDLAKQFSGWGTALKPAHEPIVLARKPPVGTITSNVIEFGTGGLNIDTCRIGEEELSYRTTSYREASTGEFSGQGQTNFTTGEKTVKGRFPANIIHDGSDEVVSGFPNQKGKVGMTQHGSGTNTKYGKFKRSEKSFVSDGVVDDGSASRFFYCPKASKHDRNEGLLSPNLHPTVKPTLLMQYLCRLITPQGGTVLDPFCGSGSTGRAAILEGFSFIGIDNDAVWLEIARQRIEAVRFL